MSEPGAFTFRWCTTNALKALGYSVAAVALAQLPLLVLSSKYYLVRPLINFDLVIALLVMVRWPYAGSLALLAGWAIDGFVGQAMVYHFQNPREFWQAGRFLSHVHVSELFEPAMVASAMLFAAGLASLLALRQRWKRHWPVLIALGLLSIGIDTFNGSSALLSRDTRMIFKNFAGSPSFTASRYALLSDELQVLVPLAAGESALDRFAIPQWAAEHPNGSIVVVLVESLGLHHSPEVRNWLTSQLIDDALRTKFETEVGEVPFRGATTAAELRLLCGMSGHYRLLDLARGRGCFPARLAAAGWSTVAMHGFSGEMFDRRQWWPVIGFQERHFQDERKFYDAPRCGIAFRGLCDLQMIQMGVAGAAKPASFHYVLTLNTHLPFEPLPIGEEAERLCTQIDAGADACQLIDRLGQVLRDVRQTLLDSSAKPLVLILGDHSPPFRETSARSQFDPRSVPAYVLRPRQ